MQQRCSCFLPYRFLQFSLFPARTHSSCVSLQVIKFSFFIDIIRFCVSQLILSAVRTSNFLQAIFLHMVQVFSPALGICLLSSTGFPVLSIFWAFEAPQGWWDVMLNSLKTIAYLHLLGSMRLVKCQDVSVGLDSFLAFSNGDSYVCNSLFSKDCCYHIFIFNMFSACIQLSTSTSKFLFFVFLRFFWLGLIAITFSISKGENLARQTSSKDSMTMDLGKSAASFSKSDSKRFFLFEDAINDVYFSLALCSTTHHRVQLVLGIYQGEKPIWLGWDRDTQPVYSS